MLAQAWAVWSIYNNLRMNGVGYSTGLWNVALARAWPGPGLGLTFRLRLSGMYSYYAM